MRLLTKTTLYFLIAMVALLAAGGYFLYRQFSRELNSKMDEELLTDELQWIRYLQTESDNGTTFILKTPELSIYPVDAAATLYPTIEDSYSARQNGKVPYRQLSHVVPVGGISYQLIIRKSQQQKAAMEANVTRIMLLVFAGLFAATLVFNWLISKRLWKPFRRSLEKIRAAELQKMEAVHFENTSIEEFNELNASLNAMAGKIHADFVNMKEFTENAAHEMQTPLAIVHSKMELLLQDSNLTDAQVESIMQASTALSRLSKLNQSLLLLAKIENNQYETNETVDLTVITKKYLQLFTEVIRDKQVTVHTNFTSGWPVKLHPLLADSLVSNLLGNAVKYNYTGGSVTIGVSGDAFQIDNTSELFAIDPQHLFKRFNKSKDGSDASNGLGLAIVKKICDTHDLDISYNAGGGVHHFTLKRKPGR